MIPANGSQNPPDLRPGDLGRDLLADLARCDATPPGPWIWDYQTDSGGGPVSLVEWIGPREIFPFLEGTHRSLALYQEALHCPDMDCTSEDPPPAPVLIGSGGIDSSVGDFVRHARDGWAVAIRRALVAESKLAAAEARLAAIARLAATEEGGRK